MSLPPLFGNNFPNYYKEYYCNVEVYWYQAEFTQSLYPPGQEISEACTLICLLVAQRISQLNLRFINVNSNLEFNIIMAEAIIEGNKIHSHIVKNNLVPHPYLNTEEALKFGGKNLNKLREWKFQIFREHLDTSLHNNIKIFLYEWYKNPVSDNLYMLLITCGRTILFIFQQQTEKVILFDSHAHNSARNSNRGLVVAQSSITKLNELCNWYIRNVIHNCYSLDADQYELACLYYEEPHKSSNCWECRCSTPLMNYK
ncbi:PREDICTED: uncharacterized protein LOC105367952 [Ceratosolen solmsi marchali]|uniref:Uncharacterized protein LOC105367952 n=1 Tax=Ceratosolen solmsi marchali TaxID=326594 RepID=A0AAJ7E271_9HYME|nr:PREDICTED: uncharacterized protein LOC105367952 [Ceratosolen solmsi marchali]